MAAEHENFSTEETDERENSLTVFSLEAKDFNSGRCRLGVSSMKKAGLTTNAAICLTVGKLRVFCRVWPASHSPPKNFIQIDPSVVLPIDSKSQDVKSITGCHLDLVNDIKHIESRRAKTVNVTVYIEAEEKGRISARLLYNKSRRCAQVKCILQDKIFTRRCWVSVKRLLRCGQAFLEEIDKIFINDIEFATEHEASGLASSEYAVAMIETDTEIVIDCIKRSTSNSKSQKRFCLAGYGDVANLIEESITLPSKFPKMCNRLQLDYPKAFLLLGPPGVGKTSLVMYLAEKWGAEVFVLNGADVFGAHMGESENNLRNIFASARLVSKT